MLNKLSIMRWFIIKHFPPIKIVTISAFLMFLDIAYILSKRHISGGDALLILFQGSQYGNFILIDHLFFIIFNGIPIYLSSYALNAQQIKCGSSVLIRFKEKKDYYLYLSVTNKLLTFIFIVLHLLAVILFCFVSKSDFSYSDYSAEFFNCFHLTNKNYNIILISGILLRFLEIDTAQKLNTFLYAKFGNLQLPFICLIVAYFLIPFIKFKFYPMGLSSVIRFSSYGNFKSYIIIVAIFYITLGLVLDLCIAKKEIFNLLER